MKWERGRAYGCPRSPTPSSSTHAKHEFRGKQRKMGRHFFSSAAILESSVAQAKTVALPPGLDAAWALDLGPLKCFLRILISPALVHGISRTKTATGMCK